MQPVEDWTITYVCLLRTYKDERTSLYIAVWVSLSVCYTMTLNLLVLHHANDIGHKTSLLSSSSQNIDNFIPYSKTTTGKDDAITLRCLPLHSSTMLAVPLSCVKC